MNLHQIVSSSIGAVNPFIPITAKISTGYTVGPNYKQEPTYTTIETTGQVQALSGDNLKHLLGLNIQGASQKVYLNGNFEGLLRDDSKGGDLLTFSLNGAPAKTYLIVCVFERWPDWCSVAVQMQVTP